MLDQSIRPVNYVANPDEWDSFSRRFRWPSEFHPSPTSTYDFVNVGPTPSLSAIRGRSESSTGSGSLYLSCQFFGGFWPLASYLASSACSQRRRRSARMRWRSSLAGSTFGWAARQSAVRSPRKAAASTDCRNCSSSGPTSESASRARRLRSCNASIFATIRRCSARGGTGSSIFDQCSFGDTCLIDPTLHSRACQLSIETCMK